MRLRWKILIVVLVFTIVLAIGTSLHYMMLNTSRLNTVDNQNNTEIAQQVEADEEVVIDNDDNIRIPAVELVTMYTTTTVNLRAQPDLESEIIEVLYINTPIQVVEPEPESEWTEVHKNNNIYYISTKYISKTEVYIKKIRDTEVTSRGSNTIREKTKTIERKSNTVVSTQKGNVLTKSKGVNYFNGHKETWYSQKVLPGKGLNIPGRHVAADGTIRDKDNYICVASSDYKKGTIVETSLGTGKVYDCGCKSGIIDIYTDWN